MASGNSTGFPWQNASRHTNKLCVHDERHREYNRPNGKQRAPLGTRKHLFQSSFAEVLHTLSDEEKVDPGINKQTQATARYQNCELAIRRHNELVDHWLFHKLPKQNTKLLSGQIPTPSCSQH